MATYGSSNRLYRLPAALGTLRGPWETEGYLEIILLLNLMNNFKPSQLRTAQGIWQMAVKSHKLLVFRLERALGLIVGRYAVSWVKAIHVFVRTALVIHKSQGDRGLAIWLKASSLILMRALAGNRLTNSRLAGTAVSVSSSGYPRWIPAHMRKRILNGDVKVVRFYLTLMTLSRVLNFRGKLTMASVTDPGVHIEEKWLDQWCHFVRNYFMKYLLSLGFKPLVRKRDLDVNPGPFFPALKGKLLALFSNGPNFASEKMLQVGSFLMDAISLRDRPELFMTLCQIAREMGSMELTHNPIFSLALHAFTFKWCMHHSELEKRFGKGTRQGHVGRLSIREEPGKLRVFAMVDSFTQSVLRPLHDWIFGILKLIAEDGTFNQARPMYALLEWMKVNRKVHVWSYDLSAATDRLPVVIQELLLRVFTSERLASRWRHLLCSRSYLLPRLFLTTFGLKGNKASVKYAVGQPMGAFSSWAMLALTHHALVQFAAYRAGFRTWFKGYAVLGDDVVIADRNVAHQYVLVMTELGVKIGFHKSIISNNRSLEFAKRFVWKGVEVTPLPLLAIACGWLGVSSIPEVLRAAEGLGKFTISSFVIAKFANVPFKQCSKAGNTVITRLTRRLRSLLILLSHPGAPRGSATLWEWLRLKTFGSSVLVPSTKVKELIMYLITWVDDVRHETLLARIGSQLDKLVPHRSMQDSSLWELYLSWFKIHVKLPIEQKFRWQSMMIEKKVNEIRDMDTVAEDDVNDLLKMVDDFEADIAAIPLEIGVQKRVPETVTPSIFRSKVVSYWTRLGEFVERPTNRSTRRRMRQKETFVSSEVLRLL